MTVTDVFFYGTLRHLPLLAAVLGRGVAAADLREGDLPDHAVLQVSDQPFPTLIARSGSVASGLLLSNATDTDVERLRFYEGGFAFDLRSVELHLLGGGTARAQVFFPASDRWSADAPWSFDDWCAQWSDISVEAAREVMDWFGRKSASDIADGFNAIRRRAAARLAARRRRVDPERDLATDVRIQAHRRPYARFFAIEEADLRVRQHDGAMGPMVNRAALVTGQAAVVLPYDPVRDRVLLVEQFRAPVFLTGDPSPWVWEPIAGLLEPGETAEAAARREAVEEAGVSFSRLEPVAQVYSSTGSSTEFLHIFVGVADLPDDAGGQGGTDLGEDIRSAILPYDRLMARVDAGEFRDMPLVTTALWLARHRDRLRAAG